MVNLHTHSEHSIGFDGYQTIPEMVSRAKELRYPALALTDHGTMGGILDFSAECEKQGIKPIYGMEAYFCANHAIKDKALTHHLVLLAANEQGYYAIYCTTSAKDYIQTCDLFKQIVMKHTGAKNVEIKKDEDESIHTYSEDESVRNGPMKLSKSKTGDKKGSKKKCC